ncbi:replication protein P [Eoetvoesiella caeni]|uniref:Phage replication protein P n=1 Tax=Eoetvoesiella caeni TaxID=645616 RepID=A0A366HBI6_9BURK|nr:replication protein P [Eoetvoesiella caeni]MCI2809371.1 replication protein P [Eoetvoesiella caeni]NYT54512.1 hypothetical protein [Eoetvoesiella caeni]RBP39298.1 hypothetical protein DFR37_10590 [Eoetvoesiella caeni]
MDAITAPLSTCNQSVWMQQNQALGMSLMDHLFNRLDGAYPRKWRADFQNEIAIANWKETWAEAFDEEDVTPTEIKTGLSNCRRMFDWPPSLTEFLRACRPGMDPEIAFHEAVQGLICRRRGERGAWSHPAIYHASVDVGQHDVLNCTYGAVKVRWEKCLLAQLAKGAWAEIPEATIALPAPAKTEQSNAEAKAAMNRMGAGNILNKSGREHKRWAHKILDNPKGRSPTVIAMAKAALEGAAA